MVEMLEVPLVHWSVVQLVDPMAVMKVASRDNKLVAEKV
jgi:hypothetical protein